MATDVSTIVTDGPDAFREPAELVIDTATSVLTAAIAEQGSQ